MLKVLIIAQDEPFYIPKLVKHVLEYQKGDYQIVGCTVLKPKRKSKTTFDWLKERVNIYNFRELFIVSFLFFLTKVTNILLKEKTSFSIKKIFKKYNVRFYITNDINCLEYIDRIKKLELDVLLSVSCPQLFKEELLKTAKYHCVNAHGTLLPRHRGVFGSWWTLYSGDKIGGSTIHTMELKLDAGNVLWQKQFSITREDTQYSIAYKTKFDMSLGIVEVLNNLNKRTAHIKDPKYKTSYHRAPTRELAKDFHEKGYKIIKLKDIKFVLASSFH